MEMIIKEKHYCSRCMRPLEEGGPCGSCGFDPKAAPAYPFALEERTVLKGRYLLGAVIGAGGFGITYAAWDKVLGMPVAVKEYFPRDFVTRDIDEADDVLLLPGDENLALFRIGLDRFLREAQLLAMLSSVPGIVSVHDYFEANDTAYIVMEYLRGETLGAYYEREKPAYSRLLAMLRQPIDALIACHKQGVLHRDISPDNLFVMEDGAVKLIDFGAAAQMERRASGQDQSVLLRRSFAPLEQYEKNSNQGPWTDVYALCATLYALMNGEPAPEAPLRQMHSALPGLAGLPIRKDQKRILEKGMAVHPENRIQSMEELRSRLYHLPLPEEILQRKRFIRRFLVSFSAGAILLTLLICNFFIGLPLGEGLLYSLRPDGFHIMRPTDHKTEWVLPSARLGIPVTSLSSDAFRYQQDLKGITIPGSIPSLPDHAFQGCSSLESVTLQEGITFIGADAFADCGSLHTLYLPASLQKIDPSALEGTSKDLFIWGSWQDNGRMILALAEEMGRPLPFGERTEFGTEANVTGVTLVLYRRNYETEELKNMMAPYQQLLSSVTLPSYIDGLPVTQVLPDALGQDAPNWISSLTFPGPMETIHPWSGGILLSAGTEIHYGNAVTTIAENAFENYQGTSLILPESVTTIEKNAFAQSAIQSISLPGSVTSIGESAFYMCPYLREIHLPASLKIISSKMFMNCPSLSTVVIPEGVEQIESSVFWGCTSLEYLHLPSTIRVIGSAAFLDCSALRYIHIPGQTAIDPMAFRSNQMIFTPDLIIASQPGSPAQAYAAENGFPFEDASRWNTFADPNQPGTIVIDTDHAEEAICAAYDTIHHLPITKVATTGTLHSKSNAGSMLLTQNQYYSESPLRRVEFPLFVQQIESSAFQYCPDLEEMRFPGTLHHIRSAAFIGSGVQAVDLPSDLIALEDQAFSQCSRLSSLSIPEDILLREITGFDGVSLSSLALPSPIHTIREGFNNCRRLARLTLQEGCREIRDSFNSAIALEEIVFPASLTRLESSFSGAVSLQHVYFLNPDTLIIPSGRRTPFSGCRNLIIHGYPGSTAEKYALENGFAFEAIDNHSI